MQQMNQFNNIMKIIINIFITIVLLNDMFENFRLEKFYHKQPLVTKWVLFSHQKFEHVRSIRLIHFADSRFYLSRICQMIDLSNEKGYAQQYFITLHFGFGMLSWLTFCNWKFPIRLLSLTMQTELYTKILFTLYTCCRDTHSNLMWLSCLVYKPLEERLCNNLIICR